MRIKEEFLEEWIKRLLSGKYKQIVGKLISDFDSDCRCAVGVLINEEDFVFSGVFQHLKIISTTDYRFYVNINLIYGGDVTTIVHLNDKRLIDFEGIAGILEKNQIDGTFYNVPEEIRAN